MIMQVAFGHEVVSDDDPYLEIARQGGYALTNCGPIGNTPVDLFPLRKHAEIQLASIFAECGN
jgi:hypothetical protein